MLYDSLYRINEVYVGKKGAGNIEKICTQIVDKINKSPTINMEREPESGMLEDAIQQCFGFRKVEVYWAHHASGGMGPYTFVGSKIFHANSKSFAPGTKHPNGFYDERHELSIIIVMEQEPITVCGLTGGEVTALLLHEIGHNFDFSPDTMFEAWSNLYISMFYTLGISELIRNFQAEYFRSIYKVMLNFDDMIAKALPPIDHMRHALGPFFNKFSAFMRALLSPTILITAPLAFLHSPLTHLQQYFTRKSEEYADSFAATYGFGPELATSLDKFDKLYVHGGKDLDKTNAFMAVLYDLSLCQIEIVRLCTGGHGTTQTRTIKVIDKLEKDLAKSDYSPAVKVELKQQIDKMRSTYKDVVSLNDNDRLVITSGFRQMVDNWFDGKDYIIIPHNPNYTE